MATDKQDRIAGMLYGSFIGDALALGAHWIYEQEELAREFGRVTDYLAPRPDSYHPHKKKGEQTHYGDQALLLMRSVETHGGFDFGAFAGEWRTMWKDYGDYQDHATKETLAGLNAGQPPGKESASDSEELGGGARIAPLLAAMAGGGVETAVAAARRQAGLTHGSEMAGDAAEYLTRLVFSLLEGADFTSAIQAAGGGTYAVLDPAAMQGKVKGLRSSEVLAAAKALGLACPAPQALPTLLMLIKRCGDDFETALIENVMAGGDNAARGLALGMILGARHGKSGIPARWLRGLEAAPGVEAFLVR